MSDKVIANFYNTVSLEEYSKAVKTIINTELIREFELMINLFESGHADLEKIGKIYDVLKKEILFRMELNK